MENVIELGIAFMCVSFNNMMTFRCNNCGEWVAGRLIRQAGCHLVEDP